MKHTMLASIPCNCIPCMVYIYYIYLPLFSPWLSPCAHLFDIATRFSLYLIALFLRSSSFLPLHTQFFLLLFCLPQRHYPNGCLFSRFHSGAVICGAFVHHGCFTSLPGIFFVCTRWSMTFQSAFSGKLFHACLLPRSIFILSTACDFHNGIQIKS